MRASSTEHHPCVQVHKLRTRIRGHPGKPRPGDPEKNSPLGGRLSSVHFPQNTLDQGYWERKGSRGDRSLLSEAASHQGTWENSLGVSSAPGSAGLHSEGQTVKDEGVALIPGDSSNPGRLASVAQGIPGKTSCPQRRVWVGASLCQREQDCFLGAPLSEHFQALGFRRGESGGRHAVQEAACEGCGFRRPALSSEAGMGGSHPLQKSSWVARVYGGAYGSGAEARQKALSHNQTSLA